MWFTQGLSIDFIWNTGLLLLGLISFCLGGFFTYQSYFKHPQFSYIPANEEWRSYLGELVDQSQNQASNESTASAIFVDVSGAVTKPGVYQVNQDSRVQDALLLAGGFLPQAKKQYIHQSLNLSHKLHDQEKIYIPLEGEDVPSALNQNQSQQPGNQTNKLSLSNATQEDLMELEGIGEKRAQDILAGAPYRDKEDFLERSGLSRNLAQELLENSIILE